LKKPVKRTLVMVKPTNFGKIAAVIVTYNIGKEIIRNVNTLKSQIDKLFIVDNASDNSTLNYLQIIKHHFPNVEITYNQTNLGLGKAQNMGIQQALRQNFDWILLLDHDSYLHKNAIFYFKQFYSHLSPREKDRVAILAPNVFGLNTKTYYGYITKLWPCFFQRKYCHGKSAIKNVLAAISSGSLLRAEIIKRLGLLREDFFIDFIDVEYCLRAISKGYTIHVVCRAKLYHKLGQRKLYKIGPFQIKPTFHPPCRRFFIYRNRVIVWKSYFAKVPSYVIYDILAAIYDFLRIFLYENHKNEKIKMAFKGLKEGLLENNSNPQFTLHSLNR